MVQRGDLDGQGGRGSNLYNLSPEDRWGNRAQLFSNAGIFLFEGSGFQQSVAS